MAGLEVEKNWESQFVGRENEADAQSKTGVSKEVGFMSTSSCPALLELSLLIIPCIPLAQKALFCLISFSWVSVAYNRQKTLGGVIKKKLLAGPKAQPSQQLVVLF